MSKSSGYEIVHAANGAMRLRCDWHIYQTSTGALYTALASERPTYKSSKLFAVAHWVRDNIVDVTYVKGDKVERLYF